MQWHRRLQQPWLVHLVIKRSLLQQTPPHSSVPDFSSEISYAVAAQKSHHKHRHSSAHDSLGNVCRLGHSACCQDHLAKVFVYNLTVKNGGQIWLSNVLCCKTEVFPFLFACVGGGASCLRLLPTWGHKFFMTKVERINPSQVWLGFRVTAENARCKNTETSTDGSCCILAI